MRTTLIVIIFIIMISSGCGGYHYTAYDGPTLPPSEIATVDTESCAMCKLLM